MSSKRPTWTNKLTFILAAAGSAIGLGNIWKFPYITGINGGSAFVMIYLISILLVGIPVLVAEIAIGAKAQKNPIDSYGYYNRGKGWKLLGYFGIITCYILLSYYSVIGGWILDYFLKALFGEFTPGMDSAKMMGELIESPIRQLVFLALFLFLTGGMIISGIKEGVERWNKIMMPALMILLLILLVNSFFLEGFYKALKFLFYFDPSKLHKGSVLEAVGHAFFTLSVGVGGMITYGSYLKEDSNILKMSLIIGLLDTLMALLSGIIVFSAVFSYNIEPQAGPSLIFQTLPLIFSQMPYGRIIAVLFFLLVAFTALTSSISIFEVIITTFCEKTKKSRRFLVISLGCLTYMLGSLSALSSNLLKDIRPFGFSLLEFFDKMVSSFALPVLGCFIAIFFGWVLGNEGISQVISKKRNPILYYTFLITIRFITPLVILWIFYTSI